MNEKMNADDADEDPFADIRHGSYYILPDSAPPLPDHIWSNIDPVSVESAVGEVQADAVADLTEAERSRAEVTARGVYYTPKNQRQALERLGGKATREALKLLDALDSARSGA